MARFSDLPLDLIPCILDYLSKKEYHTLLRVNKPISKVALQYLYRDITFKAGPSRECGRKLAHLLRTLLDRPALGSLVHCFRLHGSHPFWSNYNPWRQDREARRPSFNLWGLEGCNILTKGQIILSSNQFYQLVDEEMHKAVGQFRGRSKDALAILVLTRFAELTTLELGDGFLMYSLFVPQILKRAARIFPKLRHVILGDRKGDPSHALSYVDLDLIRPVFCLPQIQRFEYSMSEPWAFRWSSNPGPMAEILTHLHLFRSNIRERTLAQILAVTPNLKTLRYDFEYPYHRWAMRRTLSAGQRPPLLDLRELNSALKLVSATLEELSLSIRLDRDTVSPHEMLGHFTQHPGLPGTLKLKQMPHLIKVSVPMIVFLGWSSDCPGGLEDLLPHGIQDLTLRDDFVIYCPWAMGLNCGKKLRVVGRYVDGKGVYAPELEGFTVVLAESNRTGWLHDAVGELSEGVRGSAVRYRVLHEKVG